MRAPWLPDKASNCLSELNDFAKENISDADYKIFKAYSVEAAFYFPHILVDLDRLAKGKESLSLFELGGGLGILSLLLAVSGYQVHCQEPSDQGFVFMSQMHDCTISRYVKQRNIESFKYTKAPLSSLSIGPQFDYVFSVNVFEHVGSIALLLSDLSLILSPSSVIRVICPNSAFPYEPHFRVPIVISKSVTYAVFKQKIIRASASLPGVWSSLNFVSAGSLKRAFIKQFAAPTYSLRFYAHSDMICSLLTRTDKPFLARQSSNFLSVGRYLLRFSLFSSILRIFARTSISPYIDISVYILRD